MRVGGIGFVWLCFSAVRGGIYFHNFLSQKALRQFVPAQIGFVFSNNSETRPLFLRYFGLI
jgi:hypothetical protein